MPGTNKRVGNMPTRSNPDGVMWTEAERDMVTTPPFDANTLKYIEMIAKGSRQKEAYVEVFGGATLSEDVLWGRIRYLMTDEVRLAIEERKRELINDAIDEESLADINTPEEITKERLIKECEFMMRKAKGCVARNVEGIGVINKSAADVFLKSVELAAKLTGAFEQEENIDSTVTVKFENGIDDLAK